MSKLKEEIYTEKEINNMVKLLDLSLPVDFWKDYDPDQNFDWSEVEGCCIQRILNVPFVRNSAMMMERINDKYCAVLFSIREEHTEHMSDD